ncbi:MAG: hypothetical protein U0105_26120 [Candidatus Obscuribacterales bacterium]
MAVEMDTKQVSFDLDGKEITLRTGRMAKQASGAVEVRCGDTYLLVSVTESKQPREGIDFFPLLVDFEEKLYSVGRVPGSFTRREGKPTDKAILVSRLIDRPICPLFKEGYRNDVMVVAVCMSSDQENPPDTFCHARRRRRPRTFSLPFAGPIGAVRVGRVKGTQKMIINPTYEQIAESDLDIVIAGTENSIMMALRPVARWYPNAMYSPPSTPPSSSHTQTNRSAEKTGRANWVKGHSEARVRRSRENEELVNIIREVATDKLKAIDEWRHRQTVRQGLVDEAEDAVAARIAELEEDHPLRSLSGSKIGAAVEEYEAELMRAQVLDTGMRYADGRRCDEIRPITVEVGAASRTRNRTFHPRHDASAVGRYARHRHGCPAP